MTHELVASWDTRLKVGLTAYGHRKSKDCTDIEAVVPLGPLNPASFNAAVDRLQPKGKTPLSAAIQNAAEQLGYAERKATIILITDGIENCAVPHLERRQEQTGVSACPRGNTGWSPVQAATPARICRSRWIPGKTTCSSSPTTRG